jgi:hypothetical protein
MLDIPVPIFFGWPAIIVSIALCTTGILIQKPWLLVAAAIVFTPPALYLSAYPAILWLGMLLPVSLLGAAYSVKKEKNVIAWVLISPVILVSAVLAILVITQ